MPCRVRSRRPCWWSVSPCHRILRRRLPRSCPGPGTARGSSPGETAGHAPPSSSAASRAVHPPPRVDEERGGVLRQEEFESPGRKPVGAGAPPSATGTGRPAVGPGFDGHLDPRAHAGDPDDSGLRSHEGLGRLDVIEDPLEKHLAGAIGRPILARAATVSRGHGVTAGARLVDAMTPDCRSVLRPRGPMPLPEHAGPELRSCPPHRRSGHQPARADADPP